MITLEPPQTSPPSADAWQAWGLSRIALARFLKRACELVELGSAPDVLLCGDTEIRRLNRSFRGKNKATDVLSFPSPPELATVHAGDLAVSLETAARQAAAEGHSLDREVRVLLLHGLLHLAGMDHETDTGDMRAREAELRAKLRLPVGLIERVESTGKRKRGPTAKVAR